MSRRCVSPVALVLSAMVAAFLTGCSGSSSQTGAGDAIGAWWDHEPGGGESRHLMVNADGTYSITNGDESITLESGSWTEDGATVHFDGDGPYDGTLNTGCSILTAQGAAFARNDGGGRCSTKRSLTPEEQCLAYATLDFTSGGSTLNVFDLELNDDGAYDLTILQGGSYEATTIVSVGTWSYAKGTLTLTDAVSGSAATSAVHFANGQLCLDNMCLNFVFPAGCDAAGFVSGR